MRNYTDNRFVEDDTNVSVHTVHPEARYINSYINVQILAGFDGKNTYQIAFVHRFNLWRHVRTYEIDQWNFDRLVSKLYRSKHTIGLEVFADNSLRDGIANRDHKAITTITFVRKSISLVFD